MELSDRKIVWGLVLLQLAVCLPFINSFPIALDEPFSIFYAQQDVSELMLLFKSENNPPLHFILLHFWIKLFGVSATAVRSLSLIFSLLTVFLLFKFGRLVFDKRAAILLVLLFIFSRFNHYHSLEARTYSLLVFASLLAMYCMYRVLVNKSLNFKFFLILSVANAILLYTHYISSLIIGSQVIILLFFIRCWSLKLVKNIIISYIISAILYLPGLYLFIIRLEHFSASGTWVPEPEYSELYGNILRFFNNTSTFLILSLLTLFFFAVNRSHVLKHMSTFLTSKKNRFLLLAFFIPYFGMFVFSKVFQPIFLDRYLIFSSIFLYAIFVAFYDFVFHNFKIKWVFFAVILPMVFSVKFIPRNNREPNKMAAFIKTTKKENDIIAICPPFYDLTFIYHYDLEMFKNYNEFDVNKNQLNVQTIYSYDDIVFLPENKKIYYVNANSNFLFEGNDIEKKLAEKMLLVESQIFKGDYMIQVYSK